MTGQRIRMWTLPNLLTLANLACGCGAVVFALSRGDLRVAFWLVVAAALFDFLDGFAARLTGSYSELGKQLDSLSDMVSFGVAPSVVLLCIYTASGGEMPWGWGVFAVALFSALRLARFNIDTEQADTFIGMPTPASALFVASGGYLFAGGAYTIEPWLVLVTAGVLSFFLVCRIRMFALKFRDFTFRNNVVRYLFIALSAAALALLGVAAIPFIIAAYAVVSAVIHIFLLPLPPITTR